MSFCKECGAELEEDSKFCSECGSSVETKTKKKKERETVFEGNIHKCPSCGEVLKSFVSTCPQCGHEIRDTISSNSIKEFEKKLEKIESKVMPEFKEKQSVMKMVFGRDFKDKDEYEEAKQDFEEQKEQEKINLIVNYSIPNTKEDILEFMILAASNIDTKKELSNEITKAWITKLEQIYQRAELIMDDGEDFRKIQRIYNKKKMEIKEKKKKVFYGILGGILGWFALIGLLMLMSLFE